MSNDKPALTIAPEHFEDLAERMACGLLNYGLIGDKSVDKVMELLTHSLRFQANLHETWEEGDEETSRRRLMDGR